MKKRSFKKLSAILAVAMIITAIAPLSAQALYETFTVDNVEYKVYKDASGANPGEVWLIKYNATGGDVVIPATVRNASNGNIYEVTTIGNDVFKNKSITGVSIPSTVDSIGAVAFDGCASLANVAFEPGSKLTMIGGYAFSGCESLNFINLPDGLETIGERAFSDCKSLKSIDLPDGLETIGSRAFINCKSLKSIDIPKNVNTIIQETFWGCSNLKVIIFNSPRAPSIPLTIFDYLPSTGKIYYPENGMGYDDAFFNGLFERGSVPDGWEKIEGRPQSPSGGSGIFEQVNMFADVPEADIPGFGRDFRVSGEITNAPGVPESVVLRVSTPSPEFTSNKAANAAYSDALLHGQPVAFNALEVVDAVSGQAYVLPEGAKAQLKFGLGAAFADKAVTISRYDAAGVLVERFNVTCDGDGSAVINASGLGLFVITREWI